LIKLDQTTRRGKQWVCVELGSAVANEQLITINSRLSKRYAGSRMIDFDYNSLEGSLNIVVRYWENFFCRRSRNLN